MVFTLVILTIVVLVAIDYFWVSKRLAPARAAMEGRAPPPLLKSEPIPPGVFLQPGWTWSRLGEWGEIYVGVHPMLTALVGTPLELECVAPGASVARGEPMLRFGSRGRRLTVRSPVGGRVELVNYPPVGGAAWPDAHAAEATWLYRIHPDRLADEMHGWLSGAAAETWTRKRYADLRAFVLGAVQDRHLGTVMADGGELPAGVLADMDDDVWAGLDTRLATLETTP